MPPIDVSPFSTLAQRVLAVLLLPVFSSTALPARAQTVSTQLPTVEVGAAPVVGRPGQPTVDLTGPQLVLRQGANSTLGSALAGLPGLGSTWYGPNADRPIMRGLDGNRVDILGNGSVLLDASATSYDHNAPLNPLAAESIELLRGPQALLYSGGAVGGVVDVINDDIPRAPYSGVSGVAQLQGDTAFHGGAGAFILDGGNGRVGLHADGYRREAGDYSVPGGISAPSIADGRVINSAARDSGGSLGSALTGDWGYLGASVSRQDNLYGTIVDPAVQIDMRSTRTSLRGELRGIQGVGSLGLSYTHTDYQHVELDAGTPATRFINKGDNLRLTARHEAGSFKAVAGLQSLQFHFSALGDEAFLPQTRTRNTALFALLSNVSGRWGWSAGARVERAEVRSDGEADTGVARFGVAKARNFMPASASLQGRYALTPALALVGIVSHNERAPSYDELYADGPHDATGAFERGNPSLPKERSNSLELGLEYGDGGTRCSVTAFATRYGSYDALVRSGRTVDGNGNPVPDGTPDALPEFDHVGVKASFVGLEASLLRSLVEGPRRLDFAVRLDWVRADDLSNGQPLPRIAPLHFAPALIYAHGKWSARAELQMAARQTRVPTSDLLGPTPGYALLNASLTRHFAVSGHGGLWFVKLTNLNNQAAYNASSVDTVRNLVPLPGRGVAAGLQVSL